MSQVRRVIANFVLKFAIFRYHGNRVDLSNFLLTQAYWLSPINPTLKPKIKTLSYTEPEL